MQQLKKGILVLAIAAFAQQAAAQGTQPTCNPFPKTISVTGSAEMEIVPDEIYVQVDLKEYKKKNGDKIEIEQIRNEFLTNCRAAGIADSNISVLDFTGNNSSLVKKKRKDPDLIATLSYQVKFSSARKMDELVNKMDDEATSNFSVIRTSHSRITEFRKQLKINAIKSAKEKATYLCEAVNEQPGPAITIEEPQEYNVPVYAASQRRMDYASNNITSDSSSPEIDFRKLKLRFEVRVVYAIK